MRRLFTVLLSVSLAGCSLSGVQIQSSTTAQVRVFDFRNQSIDMAQYQAALNDYMSGKTKIPPVAVGLNIDTSNGSFAVVGSAPLDGSNTGVARAARSAVGAGPNQQLPVESSPGYQAPPTGDQVNANAGICYECLGIPRPTDTPNPDVTVTPDPNATPTADATVSPTPEPSGTPTTDVKTSSARAAIHARPGGCLIGPPNPFQCPPPLQPIIQWMNNGNYGYTVTGCTNGLPATQCQVTYAGPFGNFSCINNLVTGFWWCFPPAPVFGGLYPVVGWHCW